MEWGQCSKVTQVLNAIHVACVYDKINVLKDAEDLIW